MQVVDREGFFTLLKETKKWKYLLTVSCSLRKVTSSLIIN